MRFEGILTRWDDERGFGFITPTRGGQEVFVHIKAFARGSGRPALQQRLSFEVDLGPDGLKRARDVQAVRAARVAHQRVEYGASWTFVRVITIPAFVALYAYVALSWSVSALWAAAYGVASIVALLAYAMDKSAAIRGEWRISEGTLHLIELLGGWPGALLAQQWLRHKSSKTSFLVGFWLCAALNVATFLALNTPLRHALRL